MTITTGLARWVMGLAMRAAPIGRRDLALAMREEFEVLDEDRLGWALGCMLVVAGWRLSADGLFLAVLVALGLTLDSIMFLLLTTMPSNLMHAAIYLYWLAFPALVCGGLALWKPGYAYVAALVIWALREGVAVKALMSMPDGRPGGAWSVMDAPPVVGLSAVLGWCMLGAVIGARAGRLWRQPA